MRPLLSTGRYAGRLLVAAGAAALVTACGSGEPTVAPSATAAPATTEPSDPAPTPTAPEIPVTDVGGEEAFILQNEGPPPPELPAGRYVTGEDFTPAMTFTLPEGWYGSMDSEGFGIGNGLDLQIEDFADGGIYVHVIDLPAAKAAKGFAKLDNLQVDKVRNVKIDGQKGTTFKTQVVGEGAILEPIGMFADIPPGPAEVTILDVDGTTLFISLQRWRTDAGHAAGRGVLESFGFPE